VTTRRRDRSPRYRYALTSLDGLFTSAEVPLESHRAEDRHNRHIASRVLAYGLIALVVAVVGMAIVLKQIVHTILAFIS
jgi:ferric-dicitrate binding protein FerR (iron transport regulator)